MRFDRFEALETPVTASPPIVILPSTRSQYNQLLVIIFLTALHDFLESGMRQLPGSA